MVSPSFGDRPRLMVTAWVCLPSRKTGTPYPEIVTRIRNESDLYD